VRNPDELLALRNVTRATLEAEPDLTVAPGVAYGALHGVDRLHAPGFSPAHFYFAGEALQLVYVPQAGVAGARATEWLDRLGPGPHLRSRTGKRAVLEVRPDAGLAFSHDAGEVELAEVFTPMSLDAYERQIYEDPGEFIR
jgi:hypothetical protein